MKISFLLFCVLIVFFSCRKNKTADCPRTEYQYVFKAGAKLDTLRSQANWLVAMPANGNKLVFTYTMNYITCPEIADGDQLISSILKQTSLPIHLYTIQGVYKMRWFIFAAFASALKMDLLFRKVEQ